MELQEAFERRYSARAFLPDAPSKEQLTVLLEAARLAPTACNFQSPRFWVVTKPEDLAKIDKATKCRYGAPAVIVVGYDKTVAPRHDKYDPLPADSWSFGEMDATSALMQILLKATELGLATCWLGAFCEAQIHEDFDIPENIAVRALIDVGTPEPGAGDPSPRHTDRKPLEETTVWV